MIIQNIDIKRNETDRLSRVSRSVSVCERVDLIRQESCRWQEKMEEQMSEGGNAGNAGQMEEMIGKRNRELSRVTLEEMMQAKADKSGRKCPVCGKELIRSKAGAERTIESRFGPVKVSRQRGWCAGCQEWMYPADHALGLTQGGCTPGMQEMAALMVSKMPAGEASEVMERISGVRMSRVKVDREARRQGERARRERTRLDAQMSTAEGVAQMEGTLPRRCGYGIWSMTAFPKPGNVSTSTTPNNTCGRSPKHCTGRAHPRRQSGLFPCCGNSKPTRPRAWGVIAKGSYGEAVAW
jgi:hypothetical protein